MSNNNKLTVEIFRDLQTPGVAVDPIVTSVNSIARLANTEFDILRADRRLKFAPQRQQAIHADNIKWQNLPADINIVLSERPITGSSFGKRTLGLTSVRGGSGIGTRGSLISTYDNDHVVAVTSHEVLHALNLKSNGDSSDGEGHCKNEHCIMHKYTNTEEGWAVRKPASYKEWGQRFINGPTLERKIDLINSTPCSECTMQIGFYAGVLLDVKKGRSIPRSLIFPGHS